jgi:hypothetical protein
MREQEALDAKIEVEKSQAKAEKKSTTAQKLTREFVEVEGQTSEAQAKEDLRIVNWVGRLSEYRAAHPNPVGLTFVESNVGLKFTCTVVIGESSQHFGGNTVMFTKKKEAKQHAAKAAIYWLIENGYIPADGSVKSPKRLSTPPIIQAKAAKATTFAGQVPDLCYQLSFAVPTYEISKDGDGAPLYSGYAHFCGDPRISGKIGEFQNVFGKKNAKERCAEEVISFLRDIKRQRNLEQEDKKKRNRSTDTGETEGVQGNAVKQKVEVEA